MGQAFYSGTSVTAIQAACWRGVTSFSIRYSTRSRDCPVSWCSKPMRASFRSNGALTSSSRSMLIQHLDDDLAASREMLRVVKVGEVWRWHWLEIAVVQSYGPSRAVTDVVQPDRPVGHSLAWLGSRRCGGMSFFIRMLPLIARPHRRRWACRRA